MTLNRFSSDSNAFSCASMPSSASCLFLSIFDLSSFTVIECYSVILRTFSWRMEMSSAATRSFSTLISTSTALCVNSLTYWRSKSPVHSSASIRLSRASRTCLWISLARSVFLASLVSLVLSWSLEEVRRSLTRVVSASQSLILVSIRLVIF